MEKDFLKGKRIAITALELENKEHRGIASFIKSSIKVLNKYGAEIYLITGFDLDRNLKKIVIKKVRIFFLVKSITFLAKVKIIENYLIPVRSINIHKGKKIKVDFVEIYFLNFSLRSDEQNITKIRIRLNIPVSIPGSAIKLIAVP